LQEANSELAKQWHPTRNGSLTPRDVTPHNGKRVWWICDKGHEWEVTIHDRSTGTGCPYCSGRRAYHDNCLAILNLELAREWHSTKNSPLTPMDVTTGSHKKVWWICDKGHEWQAVIKSRSAGFGCPYCSGQRVCNDNCLATLNPDLAKQWHPTKNLPLTPEDVTTGTNKKVWWLCKKGHEWQATVSNRTIGHGCHYCSNQRACNDNCLATLNSDLAKEWHPTKNIPLTPEDVTAGSKRKVWWLCDKGHEWNTQISVRSRGFKCPKCSGRQVYHDICLGVLNPNLAKEWHPTKNLLLTPEDVTTGSNENVWWVCKKGHEWQATVKNRTNDSGCPECYPQISHLELRIYCELKYLFPSTTSKEKEKTLGKECDIYIEEVKAGVEVDGVYWHRNKYLKDKKKAAAIRSGGITLINVREVGLERIADTDIFCTPKDSTLAVVKKVVKAINEQCSLNEDKEKAIDVYLLRQAFANDSEYKKRLSTLSSPLPGFSLLELNPDLAKQWHPTLNGSLTPKDVTLHSGERVWWVCSKGHEWQTRIADRNSGLGCPFCSGKATCDDNCLAILNPNLAKQWHPSKNDSLTARDVTLHSSKKVWWICDKGHEWQATVASRSAGSGCSYCSGQRAYHYNCLETLNLNLAKQWHPTKNGDLTPRDFTPGSNKKVWWLCTKGHEWQASVYSRSTGRGCPYCSGNIVCNDNCLATINSDLANQWHPTKNGDLTPRDVTLHSGKNVWWICGKGHEWQTRIAGRSDGLGCPYCSGKAVCDDNCLATLNPDLAKQWHPTKNGSLTPRDVTRGSHKKVWWICDKGHEWQAEVKSRNAGIGCPYCSGKATCDDNCLATMNPDLANQWHPAKNESLTPRDLTPGSDKKVWWICDKGHEWQAVVKSRSIGNGCPKCRSLKLPKYA
jgi:hypothetical protein